jgi:DNA-binding transcriptional LysR family regulator
MELRHLRYFIAVAEYENVRAASARLHVSQPAVSRQIHDLEEELQVALFQRTTRGLKLTQAGTAFLHSARDALAVIDDGVRVARMSAAGRRGHLRVGLVDNAAWDGLVPATFGRLQDEAQEVSIQLTPMNTPPQIAAIEAGALDGGFVYLFDPLPDSCEIIPLIKHDVVLAVPLEWNAVPGTALQARQLIDQPFVLFQRQVYPAYYDRLLSLCSQAGLTLRVVQEVASEAAILSLVSAGIGLAIVNSANLGRPPARVRFIKLIDLSVPLPLSFVYARGNGNPALARFIDTLKAVLADFI